MWFLEYWKWFTVILWYIWVLTNSSLHAERALLERAVEKFQKLWFDVKKGSWSCLFLVPCRETHSDSPLQLSRGLGYSTSRAATAGAQLGKRLKTHWCFEEKVSWLVPLSKSLLSPQSQLCNIFKTAIFAYFWNVKKMYKKELVYASWIKRSWRWSERQCAYFWAAAW